MFGEEILKFVKVRGNQTAAIMQLNVALSCYTRLKPILIFYISLPSESSETFLRRREQLVVSLSCRRAERPRKRLSLIIQ
jgi:hypothetical protein